MFRGEGAVFGLSFSRTMLAGANVTLPTPIPIPAFGFLDQLPSETMIIIEATGPYGRDLRRVMQAMRVIAPKPPEIAGRVRLRVGEW